jgi:hypothetical protein
MSGKRPAPRTGAASQPPLWPGAAEQPAGPAGPSCPVQPECDVRVKRAQRGQVTWGRVDLDAEVPADHAVRAIAAVVDKLDLRGLYADVRARGEAAGAPATDPKILLGSGSMPPATASARVARSRGSSNSTPPTAGCAAVSPSPITASTTSAATTATSSASS